LTGQHRLLAAK